MNQETIFKKTICDIDILNQASTRMAAVILPTSFSEAFQEQLFSDLKHCSDPAQKFPYAFNKQYFGWHPSCPKMHGSSPGSRRHSPYLVENKASASLAGIVPGSEPSVSK